MKVISKKNTKLLVKGGVYDVVSLSNQRHSRIHLKNIGSYTSTDFTDLDGNELPKKDIKFKSRYVKFEEIRKGMLVEVCGDYKTLIRGKIYIVSDKEEDLYKSTYGTSTYKTPYLKFKGVKRRYVYNNWNFRVLPTDEAREININRVFSDDKSVIDDGTKYSDIVTKKDILTLLAHSISDKKRNNLSIEEWAVRKLNTSLRISDIDEVKDMKVSDVLKLLNG